MNDSIKQLYSSLKIGDGQIRCLVAEYYNTRFNIISSDTISTSALNGYDIVNEDKLVSDIDSLMNSISQKIGSNIEKTILILPSQNFKRIPIRVSVIPEDGIVRKTDIARAISKCLNYKVDGNLIIVETYITRYSFNGMSSHQLPEMEACDEVLLDVDLLCIDKNTAYSYVSAVSKTKAEILDISLNNYDICKETALLDQSFTKNIVLLDIGYSSSSLTLLSGGRMITSEIINEGIDSFYETIYKKYPLPKSIIERMIKYNDFYHSQDPDSIIYAWNKGEISQSVSCNDILSLLDAPVQGFVDKIASMCAPIFQNNNSLIAITGIGSDMISLVDKIKESVQVDVKCFYPDTIGVRDSTMSPLYGAFFVYKEKADLNGLDVTCLNMFDYEKTVVQKEITVEGESLTTKIKNLFELYRNKEDQK